MKSVPQIFPTDRVVAWVLGTLLLLSVQVHAQTDPLPSWNDGPAKQAIVEFVQATTTPGSPKFVPPAERIVTFDQDGTLWVSHPMYTQVIYCLDRPRLGRMPTAGEVTPRMTGDRGPRREPTPGAAARPTLTARARCPRPVGQPHCSSIGSVRAVVWVPVFTA